MAASDDLARIAVQEKSLQFKTLPISTPGISAADCETYPSAGIFLSLSTSAVLDTHCSFSALTGSTRRPVSEG